VLRISVSLVLSAALFCGVGCNSHSSQKESKQSGDLPVAKIDPATAASVSGVVRFAGTPPKPESIDMSADSDCKGENHAETVIVNDGRLENVLVYVKEGLSGQRFPAAQNKVTIAQKGCRFIPHVAAAMVGQPVEFLNGDDTLHNIHPIPKSNTEWNQAQMPSGEFARPFTAPELMIPVKCNQHPWMRMYLSVLDSPFFAVTGEGGTFTLSGLPPGTYTIAAVHEKFGEKDIQVSVAPKDNRRGADFEFRP
jgi:plastocyanin